MIDFDILRQVGTTNERLKEFFTAKAPDAITRAEKEACGKCGKCQNCHELKAIDQDVALRKKYEEKLQGWLSEAILHTLSNGKFYASVDLAWDSAPINKQIIPLLLYAQGRVDAAKLGEVLQKLPNGKQYVNKDKAGKIIGVNLPKMTEMNVNLVRSVITRRVAAQAVKYCALSPFFHYEPRSTTQIGKLRGDLTSQRVEMIVDGYNYRHDAVQTFRDMLLYPNGSVSFPRASWEREVQWVKASETPTEEDGKKKYPLEAKVVKEGFPWVRPNPSRVFADKSYPLSSLNTDTGCEYVGFWDAIKWGDVSDDPRYFNRDSVSFSTQTIQWFGGFQDYWNQYYDTTMRPPPMPQGVDPSSNDAKATLGFYSGNEKECATFLSNIWVKEIPRNWGWGEYPFPTWVHLKVAGDGTVIFADIMPSSPAAVSQFNCHDGRLNNISLAHELMQYQDQLTNLYSQLLETIKADLFNVAVLNEDVFPDTDAGKKVKEEFLAVMSGQAFYASTQILMASFQKLKEVLGYDVKIDDVFKVVRSAPNTAISEILEAIARVIQMAERLFVMSAHEQGQAATHEISATESNALSTSTDTIYNFISLGADEGRAAMKRIVFESMVACGEDKVVLPVSNRYPSGLLKKAGFEIMEGEDEFEDPEVGYVTVMGSKRSLVHEYIFTSRDGGQRPQNSQAALVLVQMVQAIGSLAPEVQRAIWGRMGRDKVYEIFNTVFRLADAGIDLKLELKPGESNELLVDENMQLVNMVNQLAQAVKGQAVGLQRLEQQIRSRDDTRININYKDAPPSIRRQIEAKEGFVPASPQESALEVGDK